MNGKHDHGTPLTASQARELARGILKSGAIGFSKHARQRMKERNLSKVDIENVIRGGRILDPPESTAQGFFKYRFETNSMVAVVLFRSESHLVVYTAFRL